MYQSAIKKINIENNALKNRLLKCYHNWKDINFISLHFYPYTYHLYFAYTHDIDL